MFDRRAPRFELPSLLIGLLMNCIAVPHSAAMAADDLPPDRTPVELEPLVRSRCLDILRDGLQSHEFWHAMHAAEGLTAAGQGAELRPILTDKLATEADDQDLTLQGGRIHGLNYTAFEGGATSPLQARVAPHGQ